MASNAERWLSRAAVTPRSSEGGSFAASGTAGGSLGRVDERSVTPHSGLGAEVRPLRSCASGRARRGKPACSGRAGAARSGLQTDRPVGVLTFPPPVAQDDAAFHRGVAGRYGEPVAAGAGAAGPAGGRQHSAAAVSESASPGAERFFGRANERLYEAYSQLHTMAQDFDKPFDSPAILVVGHQTDGKSGTSPYRPSRKLFLSLAVACCTRFLAHAYML